MTITSQQVDAWDAAVDAAYEAGRQEGMKQGREACAAQLDFNAQASSNGGDEYIAALLWQEAEEIRARGNT